jgi:hypothetical protein
VSTRRYAAEGERLIVLGHGAGAGQKSRFMVDLARGFAERGVTAVTFDFPYMAKGKKLPDRAPVLEEAFETVVRRQKGKKIWIGGKSMGGRIATHIATRMDVRGVVCFGYPLHPPGKPDKLRVAHLPDVRAPMFFVQGTRDAFGGPDELERYVGDSTLLPVSADHALKTPLGPILDAVVAWMR